MSRTGTIMAGNKTGGKLEPGEISKILAQHRKMERKIRALEDKNKNLDTQNMDILGQLDAWEATHAGQKLQESHGNSQQKQRGDMRGDSWHI
jgi:hypothetical protein